MLKAVLFDLDNTLLDFWKMKRKASDSAAQAMIKAGLKLPKKKAEEELFQSYTKHIEGERVFQKFLKEKQQYSERILAAGINAYLKTKQQYLKTYPQVKPTLMKLKKRRLKLGLITNAPKLKAYQRLDALELTNLFDLIITEAQKPAKKSYQRALRQLKLKPEEILVVGDSPRLDLHRAKIMGMKTCLVDYGYIHYPHKRFIKPDYKIQKIEELVKVLK
ncbi:MAG: HAD-IA family hydrolase [Nanoarchaeota archaeon]|nr:HAD-IA family hydrolase [Nanoarchaeota archaeon]